MEKAKKLISALLLVCMVAFPFGGCSSAESGSTSQSTSSAGESASAAAGSTGSASYGQKKVAFIATDMSLTYASWLSSSLKTLNSKYPNITIDYFDGKASTGTQLQIMETCVTKGYDYIILHPQDPDAEADTVKDIIDNGTPVMMINQSDGGVKEASNVNCDPVAYGEMIAKVANDMLPAGKKSTYNVVVLLGPSGNSHSIGRRKGYENVLFSKRKDIKILGEQICDWDKSKGMEKMEDWLQTYKDIDAVISMNDGMALGALEAAKDAGRDKEMFFFGVDGLADSIISMKQGGLTATVQQSAYTQASQGMEIIDKVFKGEEKFEKVNTDPVLITKDNMDKFYQYYQSIGLIK
ncbi:sugar ABC transporter substrate-binding protein [Caproiciproducens sp. NJN-50]|uniref:sugar ABC transporter substrate-binding protein n=1 Tax=Acutalibacteraceae TaxID=3082771 RepID=UPI000FFE27A7|nr:MULTISPECIES: sugar ABC transporter substrate-binding protein [Acutalibacteraceae]QAT50332.1 sugar ABC transporter substrate-binding protein [Caproiciproducens sp. NJN-50]